MQIIKEKLEIEDTLKKKVKNILMFLNIKAKLEQGSIINIPKTNIAYIEPHKLVINNITYLFFNECENVYINTLEKSITFKDLNSNIIVYHHYNYDIIYCKTITRCKYCKNVAELFTN